MSVTKEFYEAAWDLLVKEAGASPRERDKERFVEYFCEKDNDDREYRFGGKLGFGGKFWRSVYRRQPFFVGCYSEEETPERLEIIRVVNERLARLK